MQQARRRLLGRGFSPPPTSDGVDTSTSVRSNVTLTASGTPHAVGSWTEVVSSLANDVGAVRIMILSNTNSANTDTSILMNLGIGVGGAEATVLPNLGIGWWQLNSIGHRSHEWTFPIFIPRGSRVAAQIQSVVASKTAQVRFEFFPLIEGLRPSDKIVTIGADTATSRGVVLTQPGAINTKSAWTQITAGTTEPFGALGLSVQGGSDNNQSSCSWLLDIGVGSGGNETVVVANVFGFMNSTEWLAIESPTLFSLSNIPAGSRLACRYQVDTGTTGTSLDVILHGVRHAA